MGNTFLRLLSASISAPLEIKSISHRAICLATYGPIAQSPPDQLFHCGGKYENRQSSPPTPPSRWWGLRLNHREGNANYKHHNIEVSLPKDAGLL